SVNDVGDTIDDQHVGRLRATHGGVGPGTRAQGDQTGAGLRLRHRLRPGQTRYRRERGSAEGKLQEFAATKFHISPQSDWYRDRLEGAVAIDQIDALLDDAEAWSLTT